MDLIKKNINIFIQLESNIYFLITKNNHACVVKRKFNIKKKLLTINLKVDAYIQ